MIAIAGSAAACGAMVAQTPPPAGSLEITVHEGTSMAIALSPDKRTLAIDLQGGLWTLPVGRRRREAHHRRVRRRAPAVVVAGRQAHRVPELPRRHVADLDGAPDGSGLEGADQRTVRRSRTALVAGWEVHRVLLGSQRQLRHLDARRRERRDRQVTKRRGQRFPAGLVARRTRAGVRLDPRRPHRACMPPRSTAASGWSPRRPAQSARRRGRPMAATCSSACSPAAASTPPAPTRLMLDAREVAASEDYFPFRAQWLSADEFLYPADGKIKRRSLATGRAVADRVHGDAPRDAARRTRARNATSIPPRRSR